mmetsp:Transcript_7507/g.22228  ORF Transcript_7507/g.22228 Transcript_7507/m.22228 type:complete len:260 (-) Transcript_7507:16-795(-)
MPRGGARSGEEVGEVAAHDCVGVEPQRALHRRQQVREVEADEVLPGTEVARVADAFALPAARLRLDRGSGRVVLVRGEEPREPAPHRRRLKVDHAQAEPPAREARMLGEAGGEAAAQGVRRRQGGRRRHQVHVQPRRRPARSDGRGDACSDGREEGGVGGKGEVDHRRIRPASHRRRRRGAAGGVAVPCCLARDSAHVPHHPAVQNLPRAAARRLATAARRPAERRSHLGPGVAKDGAAQAPRVQGAARAQHIATSRVI